MDENDVLYETDDDDSWDTEEVIRWCLNDETLYLNSRYAPNPQSLEDYIREMEPHIHDMDVDLDNVDWQQVWLDVFEGQSNEEEEDDDDD